MRRLAPDVVVVDVVMPGMDGVEVIRRLRIEHPTIGLLALSSFTELERIREVIRAGANGYLVKSVDAESLAEAVRGAATGRGAFSAEVTQILALGTDRPTSALETLTPREAEIAELLAKGRSNAEIAKALELSLFTVKNHVSNILMKLHVRSRTEAAAFILSPGVKRGFIVPSRPLQRTGQHPPYGSGRRHGCAVLSTEEATGGLVASHEGE